MKQFGNILGLCFLLFASGTISAQNVGIGTSSPLSKLHVSSAASADGIMIDNTGSNGDPILQFAIGSMPAFTMGVDDSDGDKFKIGTSAITSNTRITIQSNGYLGIGTSTPSYHLHVTGSRAGDYIAYFQNSSDQGAGLVAYSANPYNAIGGISEFANGLGIYGANLEPTGLGVGVKGYSRSGDGVGVMGAIDTTGAHLGFGGYFVGGVGYMNGMYNLSDGRAKKNIETLTGALDKVMQLRGVSYQYNTSTYGKYVGNDNRTYTGFVAQEVEKVVPEAVAEKNLIGIGGNIEVGGVNMNATDRTTVKVVDYVSLVPVLVEAIKEQQAKIELLQKKIEELEAQH